MEFYFVGSESLNTRNISILAQRSSFQCNNLISYSLAARNDFEKKLRARIRKRIDIKRCRVESGKNLNIESLFRFDNCSFFFFFFLQWNITVDDIGVVVKSLVGRVNCERINLILEYIVLPFSHRTSYAPLKKPIDFPNRDYPYS